MAKVLGHLQADESRADYHGTLHATCLHVVFYCVRVGHVAQSEYAVQADSRQRRPDGRRSWGKEQAVITLVIPFTVRACDHDPLRGAVYAHNLRLHPHVYAEPAAERLRGLHEKPVPVLDRPAYVIRQAAVGI